MNNLLQSLGLSESNPGSFGATAIADPRSEILTSFSPINNQQIAKVQTTSKESYDRIVREAQATFLEWRKVPAPQRGEVVRKIGQALREHKKDLGRLVTLEVGKILSEGEGEIQEAIDIADFAVGLSRQLYGSTMHSERPEHRMYEQWHPLGIVGVITAFNFPAAVWAWNAMLAAVCGDVVLWKPSELAPLTALAVNNICRKVAAEHGFPGLFSLVTGDGPEIGRILAADPRIPLISATGSCAMGKAVGEVVARRFGKSILELGGNNAVIVLDDADLNLAITSTVFGSVGTAGQRCTSTRRILLEKGIAKEFTEKFVAAYKKVRIGDPLQSGTLMGPLISRRAVDGYLRAVAKAQEEGGKVLCGGEEVKGQPSNLYVEPTIIKASMGMSIIREETFAPIVYILEVDGLAEAIELNNAVPQGLSSAIFTKNVQAAEIFLSSLGSDCGIANVNLGTSGAEIGGAFGGEKETGGGREAGSDSWKQYMRRQTNTINYSDKLPLAQGVVFDL